MGLRSFVGSSSFPFETYCESIELFKEQLRRHPHIDPDDTAAPPAEPSEKAVVAMIAAALDEEGLLLTDVTKTGTVAIDTEQKWLEICRAAGWVVLQRYERAVRNGQWTWPRG